MSKVFTDIAISLDGFSAGPNQRLDEPFGDCGASRLTKWMIDEADAHRPVLDKIVAAKAFIMGRNMFSPGRGEWDLDWKGWWGDNPPYHGPVFVLTHHAREPIPMEGGTTFYFVTDGPEAALARAREAAGDGDISIAGGAATVRQYLKAGQIDELRLHIAPIVLGQGENLWTGVGDVGLEPVAVSGTSLVTHVNYRPSSHLTLT
jgi:dihydrofolate reductase